MFLNISYISYAQSGCTDLNACNYDPVATVDDGSCISPFSLEIYTDDWCGNAYYMGWEVLDANQSVIASGGYNAGESYTDYTTYNYDICITDSCSLYELVLYDQSGSGWWYCSSGASATLTDANGNIILTTTAQCCWSQKSYSFT